MTAVFKLFIVSCIILRRIFTVKFHLKRFVMEYSVSYSEKDRKKEDLLRCFVLTNTAHAASCWTPIEFMLLLSKIFSLFAAKHKHKNKATKTKHYPATIA